MKFPAAPIKYTNPCQLKGLEAGEWMMFPKWDGRRAVQEPGQPLLYKSGKLVDAKPWSLLDIPSAGDLILDMELMRDRAIVIDLVWDVPLRQRIAKMNELGLEHFGMPVNSKRQINETLRTCLTSGLCDGVVLKRLDSGYPIGCNRQINHPYWVKVKQSL